MTSPFDDTPEAEKPRGAIISLSLKTGPGYEAGLVNVRGTLPELAELMGMDPADANMGTVSAKWNDLHAWVMADYEGKAHPKGSAPAKAQNGRPAGAVTAPSFMGTAPECAHGVWKYVTKFKDDGNAWHAWGCPAPKGSGCESGLDFRNDPNQK
jgi:hypothetical protein